MAFSIRNLKIRDQILLVTLPPLFVLLCAVALFFYAYRSAVSAERATIRSEDRVVRSESFLRHASEAWAAVRAYVLTRRNTALVPFDKAAADALSDLLELEDLESTEAGHPQDVVQIRGEFEALQKGWVLSVIERVRSGENIDPGKILQDGESQLTAIRSQVLKLESTDERQNQRERAEAESVMRRMLLVGVSLAGLLACVLVILTVVVTRQIVSPVLQLIRASERVGKGDFSPSLPPVADNEFGILSRSFAQMTATLQSERDEIASLNRFSEAVTQCTSDREVYDRLLHALRERFQPRQVIIFRLREPEHYLEPAAALVPLAPEGRLLPVIEEPHNCKAVRTGRPFVVNDVKLEPLCPSQYNLPSEGSYYCGPLIASGIIIGSVRVHGAAGLWTPERQRLLESFLSGSASALSNVYHLDRMKQQANIDVLTGLYNRRFLEDFTRKHFAMAKRHEQPVGIIMLDLDHFKNFNDVYGHEMGDRILRHFAKTVTSSMRETNLAARYGGEEFIVVLPDTNARACMLVAERIRKAVMTMVVPSNTDKPLPQLTVSVGVAVYPDHGQTVEEVIQASDKALYESKRLGRNRVTAALTSDTAAS